MYNLIIFLTRHLRGCRREQQNHPKRIAKLLKSKKQKSSKFIIVLWSPRKVTTIQTCGTSTTFSDHALGSLYLPTTVQFYYNNPSFLDFKIIYPFSSPNVRGENLHMIYFILSFSLKDCISSVTWKKNKKKKNLWWD